MKNVKQLITIIALAVFMMGINETRSQNYKESTINYQEFISILEKNYDSSTKTTVCQSFDITIDIVVAEIETTIMYCCSTDNGDIPICMWLPSSRTSNFKTDEKGYFTVIKSSSIDIDNYNISIKEGTYFIDPKTQKPNFQFILKE